MSYRGGYGNTGYSGSGGYSRAGNSPIGSPPGSAGSSGRSTSPMPGIPTTFPSLRDKSAEELQRLLTDPSAYKAFLSSIESVKHAEKLRDDLRSSNLDLAHRNLARENEVSELRNQCNIIRTTEVAAARQQLDEAQRREKAISSRFSPQSLLDRLHRAAKEIDEESDNLHDDFLRGRIELSEFMPKYKQLRILYHKRQLMRLAAMTSPT
ncbi:hypothetical protein KFL_000910270 [Klebsormidium nitens]|uniref:VPS37 C-terminal domain-containing protein n=1 Tax=Klebsormidium nitens TaxID=105231 RepID=A0A1Y1I121_KLENI|nr:hypothetical protein KFL_000910270 [Klebsormidium nitens]|eukprot:GAQ81808.1 hypothetical protein KFL_000910270 [Klebsormidium nitens]